MKKHISISLLLGILLVIFALSFPWKSRVLTDDEFEIAERIFEDSVQFDKVKIKEGGLLTWIYPGVTLGHHISFPKGEIDSEDLKYQALLIHELTHVWQFERIGFSYISRALFEEIFTDAYTVHYDSNKNFADYDIEEQAEIVAEYHLNENPLFSEYIQELRGN